MEMTERTSPVARSPAALPTGVAQTLEDAFLALRTYDWGEDPEKLKAIEDAVHAVYDAPSWRSELEARLRAVLKTAAPRVAKGFVCRKLSRIGSAESVPVLAGLLTDGCLSHLARYALERMRCREATDALREALPKVSGRIRIGVIHSLGVRRDSASTPQLVALLGDPVTETVAAAATALGQIATAQAAAALLAFQSRVPDRLRLAFADACLACAGQLEDDGFKDQAAELYAAVRSEPLPDHIHFAAESGFLSTSASGPE